MSDIVVTNEPGPSAGTSEASYTPGPGSPEVILGEVLSVFGLEPEAVA